MNKFRIGLIFICSLTILSVLMIENNFYQSAKITKWKELSWDDFKGIPTPFSNWAAVISSNIYLEYSEDTCFAYAGQNNLNSWTKKNTISSSYSLEHEQYHFNITEIYARKLNDYLSNNPGFENSEALNELNRLRLELYQEQSNYDNATDHGLNVLTQHIWEYKIDSILEISNRDEYYWLDVYSGASLPIRNAPKNITTGFIDSTSLYQVFSFEKYGLRVGITNLQHTQFNFDRLSSDIQNQYNDNGYRTDFSEKVKDPSDHRYRFIVRDTTRQLVLYEEWIGQYPFVTAISIVINDEPGEHYESYDTLALNLLKSLTIASRDDLLITNYSTSNSKISFGNTEDFDPYVYENFDRSCLVFKTDSPQGIYGLPVQMGEDTTLIPYKVVGINDSLIEEKILIAYDKTYSDNSFGSEAVFPIPTHDLEDESFWAYMGYTLKQDSLNECYRVFGHNVIFTKPEAAKHLGEKN